MTKLRHDTQTEVTKEQYEYLNKNFKGLMAFRKQGSKYWIRVCNDSIIYRVDSILNAKKCPVV